MKYLYFLLLTCLTYSSLAETTPKNIIMIVADGMGPNFIPAYRYYQHDQSTSKIKPTVFDQHLIGTSSTFPDISSGIVTDSAASATALATGIKTYNGAIGLDINKKAVETVLERAKTLGKQTAIVVTSQINHATPASYVTHNEHRKNYNAIADSYFDDKINQQFKVDIMLGGGTNYFIREDRHLVNEFIASGYHYVEQYSQLTSLPKNKPVLGLFSDIGLPYHVDEKKSYRLRNMTQAAIKQLESNTNNNGFFMLIEASLIDWASHNNDITSAMSEIDDLAKTFEYLEHYVANSQDTLVILTADHNTGGFSIGANKDYRWEPKIIKSVKASPKYIAKTLLNQKITDDYLTSQLGFAITKDELDKLKTLKLKLAEKNKSISKSVEKLSSLLIKIINTKSNTGWTTKGHTGTDVPVYAMGINKELFAGHQDNTDIAKKIFSLLSK